MFMYIDVYICIFDNISYRLNLYNMLYNSLRAYLVLFKIAIVH